jgi:hypothetical protein
LKTSLPAGLYLLDIAARAPFKSTRYPLDVQPPSLVDELEVHQ